MRRIAILSLGAALLLAMPAACIIRRPTPTPASNVERPQDEQITGVRLRSGEYVVFDPSGAVVLRDTIFGMSGQRLRQIPLADVDSLVVVRIDAGRSMLATVGGTALTLGILAGAVVASSCPYVYSWDGERWLLDAEPYGGAVTRGLERDDWSELEHLQAQGGEFRLLMTNEVEETQHTNLAELLVAYHPEGTRVAVDRTGVIHTFAAARAPVRAIDAAGRDLLGLLGVADGRAWDPEPSVDERGSVREEIVLTFPRPEGATRALLMARATTSRTGAASVRWMLDLRGSAVTQWYAAVDGYPEARTLLEAWNLREELFVLKVEVEEPSGWVVRGLLEGGGPVAPETRAVPLDLTSARGDSLRVRLRPPRGFWYLDAISIAYQAGARARVETLLPLAAIDRTRGSVAATLRAADTSYYDMPVVGDSATLRFAAPPQVAGMRQTVFLHTRGYYRLHLPGTGPPDPVTLQAITDTPDAAARLFGRRFAEWKARRSAVR